MGTDDQVAALAKEIDDTLPAPPAPEPADASGKPGEPQPDETKPNETAKGEEKPGAEASKDGGEPGTQDDQGKGGEKPVTPKSVEDLLKDPELGPKLQSWADKSAAAQVRTAVEQAQTQAQQSSQQANMESWRNYFAQFSQEQLAEILAESPEAAQAYAAVQQYEAGQQQNLNQQQVATASQVYSYAHQIRVYNALLEESDLPQDQKDALKPENYVHLGPTGVNAWGKDVQAALIKHEAQKQIDGELNTRWEALKQERLAELEKEHPGAAGSAGSPGPPALDLITTDDNVLLENALSKRTGGK